MICWPAFTSTSKDRRIAEEFGNILFTIFMNDSHREKSDISYLSIYPHEQEVLLPNDYEFKINKVERNPGNGKYLIHMTAAE